MTESTIENELTYFDYEQDGALEEFHARYDEAIESVRRGFGRTYPHRIGGEDVDDDLAFRVKSPGDIDLEIGSFPEADEKTVDRAVSTAAEKFDEWRQTGWTERIEYFHRAAELMAERKFELAARMTFENGKTRVEAIADVDEAIDFLRYYAQQVEAHAGFRFDAGEPVPGEHCTNLLRPYGVFGIIAPFNFPLAILTGMTVGATITGNTAVVKPAEATPSIAHEFYDILEEAGLPAGVVNLLSGRGVPTGEAIVEHPDVSGIVFTGSRAVGTWIEQRFAELDKRGPVIAELGGKNPVIVTASADLDKAISGIAGGAFGFSGQKCSATARVYVESTIFDDVLSGVIDTAETVPDLPPHHREAEISPVIDDEAIQRYRSICETARDAGTLHTGGRIVEDASLPEGRYVRPTVVTGVPHDHPLAREEHFLPFVTMHRVADLDEAIMKANDSDFGLCAGIFSEDSEELDTWFDRIESGMAYANRAPSATTGALVSAQPFGGWKFSGTTGKFAGGRWYLPQFMRQQSRTRVRDSS